MFVRPRVGSRAAGWAALLLAAPAASGQVIHLPTFRVFSVGTTVVVPDRGGAYLGGVDRAAFGNIASGAPGLSGLPGAGRLFSSRASGSELSSSRAHATATIIDPGEMDRAVLGEAAARRGAAAADPAVARKAAFLARHIARRDESLSAPSAPRPAIVAHGAPATRSHAPPELLPEAHAAYLAAQHAESRGQFAAARAHYQRAAELGQGELRARARARLAALRLPSDTTSATRAH